MHRRYRQIHTENQRRQRRSKATNRYVAVVGALVIPRTLSPSLTPHLGAQLCIGSKVCLEASYGGRTSKRLAASRRFPRHIGFLKRTFLCSSCHRELTSSTRSLKHFELNSDRNNPPVSHSSEKKRGGGVGRSAESFSLQS